MDSTLSGAYTATGDSADAATGGGAAPLSPPQSAEMDALLLKPKASADENDLEAHHPAGRPDDADGLAGADSKVRCVRMVVVC
jgi:hypothetical protein